MYDQFATDAPDEAIKLAERRIAEATARGEGSNVEGLAFNEVIVNMGPQHPSTHGVLRLVVTLDGELVKDVIPVIGYLHRCKEKLAEKRTYFQYMPIVDRTEYLAGINCEWGYVLAVEKLAGIQPTRRAEFIRVITGELMRIASHLVAVGTFTADLAPLGTAMVFYMFRDREKILDLLESLSGARMMFNYFRFGGVRHDLPEGWVETCRDLMKRMPKLIDEYESLVDDNAIFLQRCMGKGVITQQDVIDYGITGPNARASGVAHDLRRTRPYSVYPELDFAVCTEGHGDVFDRYKVRMREMRESVKIVEQALEHAARGAGAGRFAARALRDHAAARRLLRGPGEPARRVRHLHRERRLALPVPAQVPRPMLLQPADLPQDPERQQDRRRGSHLGQHRPRAGRHRPLDAYPSRHPSRRPLRGHRLRGGIRRGPREHRLGAPRAGLHARPPGSQSHRPAGRAAERRRRLQDDGQGRTSVPRPPTRCCSRWPRSWS